LRQRARSSLIDAAYAASVRRVVARDRYASTAAPNATAIDAQMTASRVPEDVDGAISQVGRVRTIASATNTNAASRVGWIVGACAGSSASSVLSFTWFSCMDGARSHRRADQDGAEHVTPCLE
jgi:hypothetical protein